MEVQTRAIDIGAIGVAADLISVEAGLVFRFFMLTSLTICFGCSSSRAVGDSWTLEDLDDEGSGDSSSSRVRAERVALTTEIDPITFGPVAAPAKSFPVETRRIFLSFRLKGVRPGAHLSVAWYRRGEEEPLSETSEVLEGDQRMAAEHVAEHPFAPGEHFVRLEVDDERVAVVPFEISGPPAALDVTGSSDNPAKVSRVGFYQAVDRRGRPQGRPLQRFRSGTKAVHCAFLVTSAPRGTAVSVRWRLGASVAATTDVGQISGRRILSATLDATKGLDSGPYEVEILIDGHRRASGEFKILGRAGRGVRVDELSLTSDINPRNHRPARQATTRFDGDEETIYLCLRYQGLREGEGIEVRWIQDLHPDEPMAVSTIPTAGSGRLAASFQPDGSLPAGEYRAEVHVRGSLVESVSFTVGQ